jgi:hypothetical protein
LRLLAHAGVWPVRERGPALLEDPPGVIVRLDGCPVMPPGYGRPLS